MTGLTMCNDPDDGDRQMTCQYVVFEQTGLYMLLLSIAGVAPQAGAVKRQHTSLAGDSWSACCSWTQHENDGSLDVMHV